MSAWFAPAYFAYFRDLSVHNNKEWFEANKPRFERDVKAPLLAFIAAMREPLAEISPHFVVDTRPNGGSMFRIYRDTRFSADKTPYKTHGAAQFRHAQAKDVHAPGFYVHLGPGEVFTGVGLWRPDPEPLAKIRAAIQARPEAWAAARDALAPRKLGGDSLKRPPAGVSPDHPHVEDLRRKDYMSGGEVSEDVVVSSAFQARVLEDFRASVPFMRFLCEAVGAPF